MSRSLLPRRLPALGVAAVAAVGLIVGSTPASAAPKPPRAPAHDLGHQVITPGKNGWASVATTTSPAIGGNRPADKIVRQALPVTGGAAATAAETYVVRTWQELRDALNGAPGGDNDDARAVTTPRIIYVVGAIDAWKGADRSRLDCATFENQVTVATTGEPFAMADFIEYYDPSGAWGPVDPSGPLEDARVAAAALQARQTLQHVGSNVTLVGVGDHARIVGGSLRIRDSSNVIVRNLTISDAYDCFPDWAPGDAGGTWNSAYDNVSVWASTSVWIDHNTFDDGKNTIAELGTVYGAPWEVHDGLLDITHSSDLVTVSYNEFVGHDKTMLIGSGDNRPQDAGQHRVTLHHNHWDGIGQRAPRVRYGDVHVYNNLYEQADPRTQVSLQYFWGVGDNSSTVVENNAVKLVRGTSPATVVGQYDDVNNLGMIKESGTRVNGRPANATDTFNATATRPIVVGARWTPSEHYSYTLLPAQAAALQVKALAGAGKLPSKAYPR